jgi:ribosomal protein S18 acetylase RimI-like enzyme
VISAKFSTTFNFALLFAQSMKIRAYQSQDLDLVVALWNSCALTRPWNNPQLDIDRKLTVQPEWFLVGEVNGELMASAMFGYDGHRGWVNYLAVSPAHQRHGYARQLMAHGEALLLEAGCPKLNLQVRHTNTQALAFYARLGYGTDEVLSLGKRLIADQ